ncbi:MAG TPA: O-antigen ligase family protein [Micromonosporaceae bacterium]
MTTLADVPAAVVPARWPARVFDALPAAVAAVTVLLVCVPSQGTVAPATVNLTAADLASVALVGLAAVDLCRGRRLPSSPIWFTLAAVAVAGGVATVASPDPAASLFGFVRYLQAFVLVPVAVALVLRRPRDAWLVLGAVLVAATVEAVVGTVQYLRGTGASFAGQNVRAVGTFGALEVLGMATVVGYGLVVAVGLALGQTGRVRVALFALAGYLGYALSLSLSRGALVATVAATAAMLVAASPRRALTLAGYAGVAALIVFGALRLSPPAPTSVDASSTAVTARFATIGSAATAPDRSVQDRYDLWQTAVEIWRVDPLTGVGPRQFPSFRDSHAPLGLSAGSDVADANVGFLREPLLSPHNQYLLVLSEQGALGGLAFLALILALLAATFRRALAPAGSAGSPWQRLLRVLPVGLVTWTAVSFVYGDIGGPLTVLTAVLLGVSLWWAVRPLRRMPRGAGLSPRAAAP